MDRLAGKVVLDACIPIAGPPVHDVLPYFTGPNDSLIQRLPAQVQGARFVKPFSSTVAVTVIGPAFAAGCPTMFICGDDGEAKAVATGLPAGSPVA